jgi:hypothetical protein
MTTAATQAQPEIEEESKNGGIPWPLYPLAPFVIIPAILLGLWMWPAIAFGALTVRRAVKIKSNTWAVVYAIVFALVFVASFAWPFVLMYGISQL